MKINKEFLYNKIDEMFNGNSNKIIKKQIYLIK